VGADVLVQGSAHGARSKATLRRDDDGYFLEWDRPQRRIAPGQSVVWYDETDTYVLGGGIVRIAR